MNRLYLFFLILALVLSSCSTRYITRDSLPREVAFTKIMVLPFSTFNSQESEFSELAQEEAINISAKQRKFQVYSLRKSRKFLIEQGFIGQDFSNVEVLREIGERSGADTLIIGFIGKGKMEVRLYSGISGEVFARTSIKTSEKMTAFSVKALVELLLPRIFSTVPFDAIVIGVKDNMLKISAGRRHGLRGISTVTIFEVESYRIDDERTEYKKVPVASVALTSVGRNSSIGKIIKHNKQYPIQEFNKVSFRNFFVTIEPGKYDQ